eukprot:1582018-Amphidinium_carterae.1
MSFVLSAIKEFFNDCIGFKQGIESEFTALQATTANDICEEGLVLGSGEEAGEDVAGPQDTTPSHTGLLLNWPQQSRLSKR